MSLVKSEYRKPSDGHTMTDEEFVIWAGEGIRCLNCHEAKMNHVEEAPNEFKCPFEPTFFVLDPSSDEEVPHFVDLDKR